MRALAPEVSLRFLVTGHNGYIGTVLVPLLLEAGHEVVGLDSDLFADCLLPATRAGRRSRRSARTFATSRSATSRASTQCCTSAAVCNDPVGDLNPQTTYEINQLASVRLARAGEARPASRGSSSPPRAASTARPTATTMLDETAGFAPVTAVRRVQGARRAATSRRSPDASSRPTYLRNATAYGVLAAAATRHRGQQPRRLGAHDRRDRACRATARRGGRSCTSRTSRAPSSRCSRAPRELVHDEAFNVGANGGELQDPRASRRS